jgi:hypothetical protein
MPEPVNRVLARLSAWFDRRSSALNTAGAWNKAIWIGPLVLGLVSLLLGQDDSWDMKNYHIYNPWALLNGRLDMDMAPAQWQSYFNPALDLVHHFLNAAMPAPLAGFIMGALHGINFVLVMMIARSMLQPLRAADTVRLPLLLAVAGMCSVGFLSELGNSMGDNLSAVFVLGSLCLLLRQWDALTGWSAATARLTLVSGLVMGLGAGLKLTNATYAVALCVALLTLPGTAWLRVRIAFVFGVGVLCGVALTAGYWFATMWKQFGNPLFPQFNKIFGSPLALPSGVIDNTHVPQSLFETLAWPLVFSMHFERVSELVFRQWLWPVLYVLFLALVAKWLFEHVLTVVPPRIRFLFVFFVLAFVAWMELFGIHRYLVPLELLGPLVVWLLLHRLLHEEQARIVGAWTLIAISLIVFPFRTWGHTPWASQAIRAELPSWPAPETSIVFTALAHPPSGWMVKLLPPQVRVISVGSGFPESPAYLERIQAAVSSRTGPHYLLVQAAKNPEEKKLAQRQAAAEWLGMTKDAQSCARLDRFTRKVRLHVQVRTPGSRGAACELELQPEYRVDLAAENKDILARANKVLVNYGQRLVAGGCTQHNAFIGAEAMPYLLCRVEPHVN